MVSSQTVAALVRLSVTVYITVFRSEVQVQPVPVLVAKKNPDLTGLQTLVLFEHVKKMAVSNDDFMRCAL